MSWLGWAGEKAWGAGKWVVDNGLYNTEKPWNSGENLINLGVLAASGVAGFFTAGTGTAAILGGRMALGAGAKVALRSSVGVVTDAATLGAKNSGWLSAQASKIFTVAPSKEVVSMAANNRNLVAALGGDVTKIPEIGRSFSLARTLTVAPVAIPGALAARSTLVNFAGEKVFGPDDPAAVSRDPATGNITSTEVPSNTGLASLFNIPAKGVEWGAEKLAQATGMDPQTAKMFAGVFGAAGMGYATMLLGSVSGLDQNPIARISMFIGMMTMGYKALEAGGIIPKGAFTNTINSVTNMVTGTPAVPSPSGM